MSLIDTATEKRVWQATGKVDYIRRFRPNYTAREGHRKEFAFNTTNAIVSVFAAEVNDQEPARIFITKDYRKKDDFAVRKNKPNLPEGKNERKRICYRGL